MAEAETSDPVAERANRYADALQDIAHELLQIEQTCPCGARPETPASHPHVTGCPVKRALDIWEAVFVRDRQRAGKGGS